MRKSRQGPGCRVADQYDLIAFESISATRKPKLELQIPKQVCARIGHVQTQTTSLIVVLKCNRSDFGIVSDVKFQGASGGPFGVTIRQEPPTLRNRQGSHDRATLALI